MKKEEIKKILPELYEALGQWLKEKPTSITLLEAQIAIQFLDYLEKKCAEKSGAKKLNLIKSPNK